MPGRRYSRQCYFLWAGAFISGSGSGGLGGGQRLGKGVTPAHPSSVPFDTVFLFLCLGGYNISYHDIVS